MITRPLTKADLDQVVAIEAATNPRPWSRDLFLGELALPADDRHWLVALGPNPRSGVVGGPDVVTGFAGMMFAPDGAHLMLVAVDPAEARRGIGFALCRDLFREAATRGAEGVTLEVRASNRPAIALYERLGMEAVATRPGYYPGGEDAVIYWRYDLESFLGLECQS